MSIRAGEELEASAPEQPLDPSRRSLVRKAVYGAPTLFTLGMLLNTEVGAQCPPEPVGCPPSLPNPP
jgi:hypothetical protein